MTAINEQTLNLSKMDTVYGTVIAETKSGAIIKTDDFVGFAFCSLSKGDNCICSVRKIDTLKNRIILNIDCVLYNAA